MNLFLLLLLPLALAKPSTRNHTGYTISMHLRPPGSPSYIHKSGHDIAYLSEKDKAVFNLTKENIMKALGKVSVDKPDNIYFNSTKDFPDLYKSKNFTEIKRDFYIRNMQFYNTTSEEVINKVREFTNNGTEKIHFEGNISRPDVVVIGKHYYFKNQVPTVIKYVVETPTKVFNNYTNYVPIGKDGATYWGAFGAETINFSFKFYLNPGQTVKCIINATVVKTNFLIDYETTIEGDLVVQYGKQFAAYDVRDVLKNFNLSSTVLKSKEHAFTQYYTGYTLQVTDTATGKDVPYTDFKYTDL